MKELDVRTLSIGNRV